MFSISKSAVLNYLENGGQLYQAVQLCKTSLICLLWKFQSCRLL